MYLPLLFKEGLSCLFIGGGQVASRKIEILVEMPCEITIVAPDLADLAAGRVRNGSVHCRGWYRTASTASSPALTSDDVYWGAALAACEMIRSGTVAYNAKPIVTRYYTFRSAASSRCRRP